MKRLAAAPRTGIAASAAILATFGVLNVVAPSVQAQTPNLPPRGGGTSYVGDEAQRKLDQPLAPGVNAVPSPGMPRAPSRVGKNGFGPRAPAAAIGSVSPEVGPWHTFARVSASGLASAAGIRVVWFPGDDDTQAQAGAITATVRGRTPPDQVEIEIPADAGGPQGGVVRILARMPGQLEPVFVARFTVGTGPAAASSQVQTTTLRFTLSAGERTGAGFAVTSTGPIHVGLQSSGAGLVLSLMRPDGHSVERSGSGTLQIDDTVTDADVRSGVLWRVGVRIAHDAPLKRPVRVRRPVSATVVASGSLSVQSPKADSQRAQAALDAEAAKAKRSAADRPAAAQVNVVQIQREEQLVYSQAVAQRQSAALKQLGASVPPEATRQIQQRLSLRAQGQDLQQVQATAPVRLVTGPRRRGGSTASAGSADTGAVAPVGSGAGLATTMPDPQLTGSSVGEGDPGTPVSLTGANFGESSGEVHFIVANGRDVAAPVTYWSSAQIVTEVPYADGIPVYDGFVYVKRGDGERTGLRPFRFIPVYDVAVIGLPARSGASDAWTYDTTPSQQLNGLWAIEHDGSILGGRSDDQFYQTTRLKNGWLVDSAFFGAGGVTVHGSGNASIVELRAGTDSPYVKVHWWIDAFSAIAYQLQITVKRPRKLPCSADPCPIL